MDPNTKKSGWKIWLYLTPVYILVAVPLVKWTVKTNSGDMDLSKDDYRTFNSSEGEIKKANRVTYTPNLADTGYLLHYKSGKGSGPKNSVAQKQKYCGATKGCLTFAVDKNKNNPAAVAELFNNSFVVDGFMERNTVQTALGSARGLHNCLSNTKIVNGFLKNKVVKSALSNPQILQTVATSLLVSAILDSPAINSLIKNPDHLRGIIDSNQQIFRLTTNRHIVKALMNNPKTARVAKELRLGER